MHFSEQVIDPLRAFEPPVAKKFRVIGRDDERLAFAHGPTQPVDLQLAIEHEIAGVLSRFVERGLAIVRLLRAEIDVARYAVVFDPEIRALADLMQMRLHVVVIEIETDIAIKLPVNGVARIPLDRTPDLFRRFMIAAKEIHTRTAAGDRGIDSELRSG